MRKDAGKNIRTRTVLMRVTCSGELVIDNVIFRFYAP